eukprot:168659-Chlamydomonas_euryale.AAC.1
MSTPPHTVPAPGCRVRAPAGERRDGGRGGGVCAADARRGDVQAGVSEWKCGVCGFGSGMRSCGRCGLAGCKLVRWGFPASHSRGKVFRRMTIPPAHA